MIEMWDEEEKQMQCVGVAALHIILHPRGLSLPNFDPSPCISYIIKGQAIVGISYPWCPSTFDSGSFGDSYQKTMRFKQVEVVAVPPGVIYWCYNDGEEDLVAITIVDLKSGLNQLDPKFKTFCLAGDMQASEKGKGGIASNGKRSQCIRHRTNGRNDGGFFRSNGEDTKQERERIYAEGESRRNDKTCT